MSVVGVLDKDSSLVFSSSKQVENFLNFVHLRTKLGSWVLCRNKKWLKRLGRGRQIRKKIFIEIERKTAKYQLFVNIVKSTESYCIVSTSKILNIGSWAIFVVNYICYNIWVIRVVNYANYKLIIKMYESIELAYCKHLLWTIFKILLQQIFPCFMRFS